MVPSSLQVLADQSVALGMLPLSSSPYPPPDLNIQRLLLTGTIPKWGAKWVWEQNKSKKHTTLGIRWSSPTQLLVQRFVVYVQGSGRDPQFSTSYGRM